MKSFLLLYAFIFFGVLLPSCAFFDFKEPKVTGYYPRHNQRAIPNDALIWLEFSENMDTEQTENAFSLASENHSPKGEFSWQDRRMIFTPKEPLLTGEIYTVTLAKDAEDENGNNLQDRFKAEFTVNEDDVKPTIVSHEPAHGQQGILVNDIITIVFSEAIDEVSLQEGLFITPSIVGNFTLNATGETVTFTPLSEFIYGTIYTVSITEAIKDVAGNSLFEGKEFSFIIGEDFIKPVIESASAGTVTLEHGLLVTGISKLSPMVITFSEKMADNELLDAIYMSPSASLNKSISTTGTAPNEKTVLTIIPVKPLEPETNYSLEIQSSAIDIFGNILDKSYSYKFLTNSDPDSTRPGVLGIRQNLMQTDSGQCVDPPDAGIDCTVLFDCAGNDCWGQSLSTTDFDPAVPDYLQQDQPLNIDHLLVMDSSITEMYIILVVYFDKPMNRTSLIEATSLKNIIANVSSPFIADIQLSSDRMQMFIYIRDWDGLQGYNKIIVKKDIAEDTYGNGLNDDYVLYLN